MKQLSGFLFLLVLTGPFVLNKTYSPTTSILPSIERPDAAGRNKKLNIFQGESLRLYLFCGQENLNSEKVWCKGQLKVCLRSTNPVIFSKPEWKILTMASNQKVKLGDSKKGCASVHITTVEIEDSGLYWFGLLDGQKIDYLSPINMVVHKGLAEPSATTVSFSTFRTPSFESPSKTKWRPVEVTVVQGEPLSLVGFCGQQHLKTEKVWCKGELLKECDLKAPRQLLGPGWKYLTAEPNQRVIIRDSRNGCVSLFMSDLQLEDSGIYWFGFLDGWNIIPLKKITVTVQEEQKNNGNMIVTKENKPSTYHVVLVVGSTVVGILIITFITTLLVMMFTKSNVRVAAEGLDGGNLNSRRTSLQMHESSFVNSPLDTETIAIYAVLKKPKSRAEEVTYVNTKFLQRSSEVSHPNKAVSVQSSLGPGVYANISIGSRDPHNGE